MTRIKLMLLSALSVVLVAGLIGGATFALFTAQTTNQENTFTAGTLSISNANKTAWHVDVANMAPGDVFEKVITVTNTGSLELEFAGTFARSGAIFQGATPAFVELFSAYGTLAPGATKDVTVRVSLPLGANNSYQTATGSLTITFNAFQTKNLTPAAATWVKTNDNVFNASRNAYYDGYELRDAGNVRIDLIENVLLGMYEIRPDGTVNYLQVSGNADPKFWMNNARPDGAYNYVVVTKSGTRYTATLNHVSN